ncbi:MAG: hypothetical protein ACLRMZ_26020 [Blautia marasmi]
MLLAYGAEAEILDESGTVTRRLIDDFVEGLRRPVLEREVILKFVVRKQRLCQVLKGRYQKSSYHI